MIERAQWNKQVQDVPFHDGNQLSYVSGWERGVYWEQNSVFEDELTFVRSERGRSAAHFIFQRKNGKEVVVFMKDLTEMFPLFVKGKVKAKFTFCKRGSNYGCQVAK